jgi:hypothetical protein
MTLSKFQNGIAFSFRDILYQENTPLQCSPIHGIWKGFGTPCYSIRDIIFSGSWKLPIISDQSEVYKPIFICKHMLAVDTGMQKMVATYLQNIEFSILHTSLKKDGPPLFPAEMATATPSWGEHWRCMHISQNYLIRKLKNKISVF